MRARACCVIGWVLGACWIAPPLAAQPTEPTPLGSPAPVEPAATTVSAPEAALHTSSYTGAGLVLGAGLHTGLALGVRLGVGDLGIELTGGYQPVFAIWQHEATDLFGADVLDGGIDAASSLQLASELYFTPWHPVESSSIGLKSGYRYNTVLTHGFSVAIVFLVDLGDSLALEGLAGASIFPGQNDRLRRELGLPADAHIRYGSAYQVFEYGFELIWYP